MQEVSVWRELVFVLGATVPIVFVFRKLHVPAIVGFLLAGVIMGPHSLQLIQNVEAVEALAEIGLILLLFTIGIEFSLKQLRLLHHSVIWAGVLQILLTTLLVTTVAALLNFPLSPSLFYGFLVSLSSTAIVLGIYHDRREIHSLHGRLAAGMLLLQDLCIVPMMVVIPVLGQAGGLSWALVGLALLKAVALLALIVLAARALFPWLLRQVAFLRDRALFILFIIFVCLTTAYLTREAGLSLALGGFIAGLVISESEFSHQVIGDIEPLKDCFSGIFFISIGMLLKLDLLLAGPVVTLQSLVVIVAAKFVVVAMIFWWLYRSLRLGILLGFSLAQIGEFSFILATAGRAYELIPIVGEQPFLAASVLSMIATPFLIHGGHAAAYGLDGRFGASGKRSGREEKGAAEGRSTGHVIAVGYGLNGQNLTRVLKEVGIPYRILDFDPDVVRQAKAAGEPIEFGDGTRPEVLRRMGIDDAQILVVAISDSVGTAHMVSRARSLRPDLYILVRTRYVAEIDHLYRLGADQVIPEEFETSIEMFAQVLQQYHIPRNVIAFQVDLIRKEHYGTLRGLRLQGRSLDQLSKYLAGTTTELFQLFEDSPAAGKTLGQTNLRSQTGVNVIVVVRNGVFYQNPGSDFRLAAGDVLVLLGNHKELDEAMRFLEPAERSSAVRAPGE